MGGSHHVNREAQQWMAVAGAALTASFSYDRYCIPITRR
jgi:hypothetical protein